MENFYQSLIFPRFGVGQNLYIYKQTLKAADNDWVKAVTDWYDEVALFRNRDVEPFSFSLETGHYTQVGALVIFLDKTKYFF